MRLAVAALLALTLVRLVVAAVAPLAPDEAYYWVWSRALAPGYLDAPPMVALWIRAGTAIAGPTALGIRLLGPISAALGSVLLWDAAESLLPGFGAGVVAAALLNATLLFGVGTVIMTPDTPLLFFWVACFWALARFNRSRRGLWLVLAGALGGLALASKYTAVLLAPAVLVWLLLVPELRPWLDATAAVDRRTCRSARLPARAGVEPRSSLGELRQTRRSGRRLEPGRCGPLSGRACLRTDRAGDAADFPLVRGWYTDRVASGVATARPGLDLDRVPDADPDRRLRPTRFRRPRSGQLAGRSSIRLPLSRRRG